MRNGLFRYDPATTRVHTIYRYRPDTITYHAVFDAVVDQDGDYLAGVRIVDNRPYRNEFELWRIDRTGRVTTVLTKARIRNTRVVLQVVQDCLEEFRRESPPIITAYQPGTGGKMVRYRSRYGEYPPDETEVFTERARAKRTSLCGPSHRHDLVGGPVGSRSSRDGGQSVRAEDSNSPPLPRRFGPVSTRAQAN